jgi:uncharacterized protein
MRGWSAAWQRLFAGSVAVIENRSMDTLRSNGIMRRLPLGSVRPMGWLRAQMLQDLDEGFAGRLDELSPHVARDLFSHRLEAAVGQTAWWDAESRGNWLWGYAMLAHLCDAPAHRERVDRLVRTLRSTQDSDGYIGIHAPVARYPSGEVENGELWSQSRALLALLAHHELTGEPASLDAARSAADLTLQQYGDARPHFGRRSTVEDRTGMTHGLCYTDALQWLHEISGDERYRRFAQWFLRDFDAWEVPFPNDDLCAANLADPGRSLRGHAVHTVEHLRALAFASPDATRIDRALRKLLLSTTPSGAVIGDESLHGLPRPDAAYEYCSLTELLFSLGRLAQRLADPALGDWMERLAFNAAQGARQPNGRAIAYLCSDTRVDALASSPDSYSLLTGRHGRFKLSATHDDVACCCNPNATRLLPHYVAAMWFAPCTSPGLVAMSYGPSELQTVVAGCNVTVRQDTAYPFEDEIRFAVSVAAPLRMVLWLRMPAWADAVDLDGVTGKEQDRWLVIDRLWQQDLEFKLRIHCPVRVEPYAGGGVAVLRGPLQFVQPIRHRTRTLRPLAVETWHDEELLPLDITDVAAAVPLLDASVPDLGFATRCEPTRESGTPWDRESLRLVRAGLTLVPMGCAPLRRALFLLRD